MVAERAAGEGWVVGRSEKKHTVALRNGVQVEVGVEGDWQVQETGANEGVGVAAEGTVVEGLVEIVEVVVWQEEEVAAGWKAFGIAGLELLGFEQVAESRGPAEGQEEGSEFEEIDWKVEPVVASFAAELVGEVHLEKRKEHVPMEG